MRTGSETEDKGTTPSTGSRPAASASTGPGNVPLVQNTLYLTGRADDMVANAAIVEGGSGTVGEVGAGSVATVYDSTGSYRRCTTTGANNEFCGWNNGGAKGPEWSPMTSFLAHFRTGSAVTNVRYWIAVADGDITATSNPLGVKNAFGFRYATDLDGGLLWKFYTNAIAPPTIACNVQVVANFDYYFELTQVLPDVFRIAINGITIANSFQPLVGGILTGVKLGWTMGVTALTGSVVSADCGFFRIYHK